MADLPKQFTIDRGLGKYKITDYYAILGVPLTANPEEIRKKFLAIAKALHPDTFTGTDRERLTATMFFARMISPAYQILTNDRSRSEYIATLKLLVQNLKKKDEQIEVKSEVAKNFQKDFHPTFYPSTVETVSRDQYQNIDKALTVVADLSEINLIYLMAQDTISVPKTESVPFTTSADPSAKIRRELQMAELYIGKKQWTDALKELKTAEKKTTESANLYYLFGVVYLNQSALSTARTSLQKALKIDPKHEEAKKTLTEVEKKMAPKKEEKKGWFGIGKKK
ncbi:MAG: molecular chaperone DnaJ [Cyanobacteria bacterium M5B4]|nr:MAG: molecular chaperone DnaJ [Cyanobacteria bacterium M5B4]